MGLEERVHALEKAVEEEKAHRKLLFEDLKGLVNQLDEQVAKLAVSVRDVGLSYFRMMETIAKEENVRRPEKKSSSLRERYLPD